MRSPTLPIASPAISAEWTGYHRDPSRDGAGPAVPALTSPSVAWKVDVDGDVYASPLIVQGHVIVATENDTVYSLDLFTGSVIWKIHLGDPVDATSLPCGDIRPVSGITGTPTADTGTGRLYVVAFLQGRHHMLFGLSLVDGSVVLQRDVDPAGSDPAVEQQRGALALGPAFVYVPLGGLYGDCGAYHGYLVAVPPAGGPAPVYRVPSARGAGIWSSAGPALDATGNVYLATGNSTASPSTFDYSNSIVELSGDLLKVKSYFAPANWRSLNAGDVDLGSLGPTLLPSGDIVVVGKEGVAYLLRGGQLGGVGGQVTSKPVCGGALGGTAVLQSTVFVPCTDGLYALSVGSGSIAVIWHASHPVLGSPITSAGAVWCIDAASAILYALDPATGTVVFSLGLGATEHFSTPAATEGFVIAPAGRTIVAVLTAG
ncbi:MAG: PQQ-binding-like beta-propeller repeat protein [Candidatus Dormibacteraceae bacterium]